jgi:hypothetical protein
MRRSGSTGRSIPTILAMAADQAPQQLTAMRVEMVSRAVFTAAMPFASRSIAITSASRSKRAPLSMARSMKPVMTL